MKNMLKRIEYAIGIGLLGYFCMKGILYTLDSSKPQNFHIIKIEKTAKGFNTYYEDGTLQHEFTKQNTDSLSLETIKMIYEGE